MSVVARCHGIYYDDIGSAATVRLAAGQSTLEGLDRVLRVFTQSLKVITIAALAVVVLARECGRSPMRPSWPAPATPAQPVMFTVFEDQTDAEVADELAAQGLIRSTLLFQGQFKLSGGALMPGTYTLRKGMSVPQIVDRITGAAPRRKRPRRPQSTAPESFDITIPEGWRIEQIARGIRAARRQRWRASLSGCRQGDRSLAVRFSGRSPA